MDRRRPRRQGKQEPQNFLDSFIFKFSSRTVLGIAVILIFLTLVQCSVKKPESPEWTTTFVVPVVNRTYDMVEIVSRIDQDEILIDSSGDVAFSISKDLDTIGLGDSDFSVPDLSYYTSEVLGQIQIEQPNDVLSIISLESLTEGFPRLSGFDTVIVPANTQLEADANRQLEQFEWADITTGSVKMVVTNELGLTLYDVVIRVIDSTNGRTIDYDSLGVPLAHGDTDSAMFLLDGESISNNLSFSIVGNTDPDNTVYIPLAGSQITTEATFPDPIVVTAAMAQVPALDDLEFSQTVDLDLDASETIDTARLEAGMLNLVITNKTRLVNNFTITVPNLLLDDVPLTISRQVAGMETAFVNNDVSGYDLIPENDAVNIDVVMGIPGSGGATILIRETDSASIDAGLTGLSFSSVTGMFAGTSAEFDDIHEDLDVPDGFDNISFATAILTLEIQNGVDMPGHVNITITGNNGEVVILEGDIEPRGDQVSRVSTISNNDIGHFLTPIPSSIDVTGEVIFGDGSYHGTLSRDDFVSASVRIYAPLEIRVNNAEITDLDIEVEEINQDDMEAITDQVVSARFIYSVTNHLPLGVTALIHLSSDSASLYTDPDLTIDTLIAEPAPVSLITGVAIQEAISTGEIYLSNEDIQILKNDSLFIRQQLFLTASDTAAVKITENDYITISGRIEVEYLFDGEF